MSLHVCISKISDPENKINLGSIYKQRVKVREQIEEADQYSYERSSLQSLKAFEWLSLDHFSASDESRQSAVRIPSSYFLRSPTPFFHASKEEENKDKKAMMCENRKKVRAASPPRPRAVLSSPDNDGIVGNKTRTRRELLTALKNHNSCQNRHTRCKIFPRSEGAEIAPPQGHYKVSTESKYYNQAKGRTNLGDSRVQQDNGKG